ncbi:hypothetical protein [Flavobacterium humidisoli]|uniref:SprB repeat-containing protein n=1 Tax=Flavobacterium humidisoli TaxID=2937442 RepID=A0ABY4M1G5_9FLAO|nr:hypothetical protein [Flavobacterium humidisoli]UPZ17851.1 hypothetical protein M0M44_10990 [Flavobacterium humidisoli]
MNYFKILCLFFYFFYGSKIDGQCKRDTLEYSVNSLDGSCYSNGVITVSFPASSLYCGGWEARIVKTTGGAPIIKAVPVYGGDVNFTSLPPGSYEVILSNGNTYLPYSSNPVSVSSSYTPLNINVRSTAPSCPNDSMHYAKDGTLTVDIPTGGIGPFKYEVITSAGTQVFVSAGGSSEDRTHTFFGMQGGETVTVITTDLADNSPGCAVSATRSHTLANNTSVPLAYDFRAYNFVRNSSNCSEAKLFVNLTDLSASQLSVLKLPSNAVIIINGVSYNLSWNPAFNRFYYDSSLAGYPALADGTMITTVFNDGCSVITRTSAVSMDDTFLDVGCSPVIDQSECKVKYQIQIIGDRDITVDGMTDRDVYFCSQNALIFEVRVSDSPEVWRVLNGSEVVPAAIYPAGNPMNVTNGSSGVMASAKSYWNVFQTGVYRVTASDNCHNVQKLFEVSDSDPFRGFSISEYPSSLLQGTSTIKIKQPNANFEGSVVIKVSRVDGQSGMAINPNQPYTLAGSYAIDFPIIRSVASSADADFFISDLPLGDYNVEVTSGCGSINGISKLMKVTLDQAADYNPYYNVIQGCGNSHRIDYDLNQGLMPMDAKL